MGLAALRADGGSGPNAGAAAYLAEALPLARALGDERAEAAAALQLYGAAVSGEQRELALASMPVALAVSCERGDRAGELAARLALAVRDAAAETPGGDARPWPALRAACGWPRSWETGGPRPRPVSGWRACASPWATPPRPWKTTAGRSILLRQVGDKGPRAGRAAAPGRRRGRAWARTWKRPGTTTRGSRCAREMGDRGAELALLLGLAPVAARLSEPRRAADCYRTALALSREQHEPATEANILIDQSNAWMAAGEANPAVEGYRSAVTLLREAGRPGRRNPGAANAGGRMRRLGQGRRGRRQATRARSACSMQRATRPAGQRCCSGWATSTPGWGGRRRRWRRTAKRWTSRSSAADHAAEADLSGKLAMLYASAGDTKQAIHHGEHAMIAARAVVSWPNRAPVLRTLGDAYADTGDHAQAMVCYRQALFVCRAVGDRRTEAGLLNSLGNASAQLGMPKDAVDFYTKALEASRQTRDRALEGNILNNLGNAHADMNNMQAAVDCYRQSVAISRALGEKRKEANRLANLGLALMEIEETRRAVEAYTQAVDIFGELGDRGSRARHSWMLGMLLQRAGQLGKAAEVMQVAVDYEQETGAPNAAEHAAQVARLRRAVA